MEVLSFQRLERLSWSLPWRRACSLRGKLILEVGFMCVAAAVKATCWHHVLVRLRVFFKVFLFSCTAISCSDAGLALRWSFWAIALMSEQAAGTTPTEALVIEQGPKPPVITTESFNIAPHAPQINWASRPSLYTQSNELVSLLHFGLSILGSGWKSCSIRFCGTWLYHALSQRIQHAFRCGHSDHCSLANKL